MAWSERQRAMLAAMGLRVWPRAADGVSVPAVAGAPAQPSKAAVSAGQPTSVPAGAPGTPVMPAGPESPAAREAPLVEGAAATVHPGVEVSPRVAAGIERSSPTDAAPACRPCQVCDADVHSGSGVLLPQAAYLVVGIAPGATEAGATESEAVAAASSGLLGRMMTALCLTRADDDGVVPDRRYVHSQAIRRRPPQAGAPRPGDCACCEPRLQREIGLVQPRVVLALGRPVAQALLRSDEPLGKLRGRVHRYMGAPLVVTYEPAYLLRNPLEKARAWEDLCLAARVAEAPG